MENVDNADQKKKSPFKFALPLILLLLVGVIGFGVYEYFRIAPRDVRFTNVTSSSVTVSWNTKSPTSATALVFEGDILLPLTILGLGGERFYDTRDVKVAELRAVEETSTNLFNDDELGVSMEDISTEIEVVNMGEYYTHHVTISGLDSEKEYSFMIGDSFLYTKANDVDGVSTVETLAVPNSVEAPIPAYGSIKDAQNSEDPEMLAPVYDGIVYFNLMDEFSGNRSNVYSGALNEEGNWYIDISGIRVEEGEDFLSGEVIANVVGEIAIDAGPDGKWEGVLNSDIIAPAEMIVINDPLQGAFDGAGIKKIESNVLGDFTFDTEAAGCTFAGYCGPCYDGVLTNPCSCPQDLLNSRPGCKGQEDGTTMEQAIAAVATASSKCSGGKPFQYVYFGECKQCLKYIDQSGVDRGYRWQTAKDQSMCKDNKSGTAFGPGEENPLESEDENSSCSPNTPQSALAVGVKCCSNSKKGIGKKTPIERCPEGSYSNGTCEVLPVYCDVSGSNNGAVNTAVEPKVGEPCDVPHGSGKWITRLVSGVEKFKCTAISCDEEEGYVRRFDIEKEIDVCVKESGSTVGIVNCADASSNLGDVCASKTTSTGMGYDYTTAIIYSYCTAGGLCKEDGVSCGSDSIAKVRKAWLRGVCTNTTVCTEDNLVYNPTTASCTAGNTEVTLQEESSLYDDESCWKGASRGYYRIKDGKLQRCRNNGKWIDEPTSTGSQKCLALYQDSNNLVCNLTGDFCSIPSEGGGTVDYYCDGDYWRIWETYKNQNPNIELPAGQVEIIGAGDECQVGECLCPGDYTIPSGSFCPEVALMSCTNATLNQVCSPMGYTCQQTQPSAPHFDTQGEVIEHYTERINEGSSPGVACAIDTGFCYNGYKNNGELELWGPIAACRETNENTLLHNTDSIGTKVLTFVQDLGNEVLAVGDSTDYLIDSQTGMISEIEPGSYLVEHNGEYYAFEVTSQTLGQSGEVLVYLDKDGNGEYNQGVDTKISEIASQIKILTLSKTYNYELKEGFNFVSLPFLVKNEDSQSAASLLKNLNEIYDNSLFSISKYEGGRWKIVGQNTVVYGNNDFQLLPGEGYVIKAKEEITVSVIGQPVKYETTADSAPVTLFEGWNLIGLYGTGVKTYTAKTMIADINAANFTADNVSKWEKEKQSYEGFQFSEGQEYGFDFPINSLESVFVRVLEGRGNWQPKLGSQ